jgi:hypothetical protein
MFYFARANTNGYINLLGKKSTCFDVEVLKCGMYYKELNDPTYEGSDLFM